MFMWEGASRSAVTAGVNKIFTLFFWFCARTAEGTPPGRSRYEIFIMLRPMTIPHAPPDRGTPTPDLPARLHNDSHRADPSAIGREKTICANVAAGGHGAREVARWRRWRLRLRPGGRWGRCRCAYAIPWA